jgi:predicted NUDIX family NTP pyrophosphohydrolase
MKKQSAGILPYKFVNGQLFFFIAHPGGPFYRKKDNGFWGIVKGEFDNKEKPLQAAKREFKEETNIDIPVDGILLPLTPRKQKSGKLVHVWAIEYDFPTGNIQSNSFQLEWPPKSGVMAEFPELDKFEWFDVHTTISKLLPGQVGFVEEVLEMLGLRIQEKE